MAKLKIKLSRHTRSENLAGRKHLVVPTVPIIEGVFNGVLLKSDTLKDSTVMWNSQPVYYNHPVDAIGFPTAVYNRDIFNDFYIGTILNAEFGEDGLQWETWIDEERLKKFNPDTLEKLKSGEMEEGSVGYWTNDYEFVAGEFDGEPYFEIDYNIKPDHFAVLGDEEDIGACSIEDGCGCNRTNSGEDRNMKMMIRGFKSQENISQDDIGTGDKIEMDNSSDEAHEGSWGNIDHVKDRNTILKANNYKSLTEEMYLIRDDNWEEAPSQRLHYPHHTVIDGELVVSEDGVKSARSFLERGDTKETDAAYNHLKRHYNELGLEWENDNKENVNNKTILDRINELFNKNKEQDMSKTKEGKDKKVFQDCDTVEDCKAFTQRINDTGVDTVKKLLDFNDAFGVEKIEELIGEFKERQEQEEKEIQEMRDELVEDFDFSKDEVSGMGFDTLKSVKNKLTKKDKKGNNYLGNNGNSDGKNYKRIPFNKDKE